MAIFLDVSSVLNELDLTTIVSADLVLDGPGVPSKTWTFTPNAVGRPNLQTFRHDFVEGDTDTLGPYRAYKLTFYTDAAGVIPVEMPDTTISIIP